MSFLLDRRSSQIPAAGGGVPDFEPHRWLKGGHAQTIAGRYWPSPRRGLISTLHELTLEDGDRLVLLESTPRTWQSGRPTAMLVHGLAGCAEASYVVRLGIRLVAMGYRVVRVNLRNAGCGFGLARGIYHAGRSDDLRAVVDWIRNRNGDAPMVAVGFSLGANLVLKLAAEIGDAGRPLAGVVAANPPVDLAVCARRMGAPGNRIYDWNFVRWLRVMVVRLHRRFPELGPTGIEGVRTLYEFDDRYTAVRNSFASADDYYERCSSRRFVGRIASPGLIVHAMDDPFIPHEPFLQLDRPHGLELELVPHGGHLGYLSRRPWQGDRRWLDARLAGWLTSLFRP